MSSMDMDDIKRAVIFCTLMQNNGGILGKAPSYIAEKLSTTSSGDPDMLKGILDTPNTAIYEEWLETWA